MNKQKFLFDNNIFDDDNLSKMTEEELRLLPEFTKEQMEKARKQAFAEGKKLGIKESEEGLTKTILLILQKIEKDVSNLFNSEKERNRIYENEVVNLSLLIIKKLFPLYSSKYGLDELENALKQSISEHNIPKKIEIELNKDILQKINTHIKELGSDLDKEITMIAKSNLNEGEYNISWDNGGIVYNREEIAEKTFQIMKETLAERGISVHDKDSDKVSGDI